MPVEAAGRQRAQLEADLLGVRLALRLQHQRALAVALLDQRDRRLEHLDRAVGAAGHRQRERELAHAALELCGAFDAARSASVR